MVIKREDLFGKDYFEGFQSHETFNFQKKILTNRLFMNRGDVEHNPVYQQPIPYAIIYNPKFHKYFAYQQSSKIEHVKESRLHGKWSWGVGGHIDIEDDIDDNPIECALRREIKEETTLNNIDEVNTLGYINLDHSDVDQVHFGILYIVKTNCDNITARSKEIFQSGYKNFLELTALCVANNKVEKWSVVALKALNQYEKNCCRF